MNNSIVQAIKDAATSNSIPYIKGVPLLGILPRIKKDPLALIEESHSRFGNLVEYNLPLPRVRAFGITDPDLIKFILLNDEDRL